MCIEGIATRDCFTNNFTKKKISCSLLLEIYHKLQVISTPMYILLINRVGILLAESITLIPVLQNINCSSECSLKAFLYCHNWALTAVHFNYFALVISLYNCILTGVFQTGIILFFMIRIP